MQVIGQNDAGFDREGMISAGLAQGVTRRPDFPHQQVTAPASQRHDEEDACTGHAGALRDVVPRRPFGRPSLCPGEQAFDMLADAPAPPGRTRVT